FARAAEGLPAGEVAHAIEAYVGEAARALRADDDEVGLRVRRVGEEDVGREELGGRDDVDELGIAAAGGRDVAAAGHVRGDVERVQVVLALDDEGAGGFELGDLASVERAGGAARS